MTELEVLNMLVPHRLKLADFLRYCDRLSISVYSKENVERFIEEQVLQRAMVRKNWKKYKWLKTGKI